VIEHRKSRIIVATRIGHVVEFAQHIIATSDPVNFA
jgi:hypothetical protein